ncbi:MAG: hypothetical protein WCD69_23910 [Xanthobacteraceae bacterium]
MVNRLRLFSARKVETVSLAQLNNRQASARVIGSSGDKYSTVGDIETTDASAPALFYSWFFGLDGLQAFGYKSAAGVSSELTGFLWCCAKCLINYPTWMRFRVYGKSATASGRALSRGWSFRNVGDENQTLP